MALQLNIKDGETVALARRLAQRRRTSVTAVVREALRAEERRDLDDRMRPLTPEEQADVDAVMAIAAETAPRLRAAGVTMQNYDADLYDEDGLPK